MKIFQKGFNFSQDGPGNRLVYHMTGCNLACKWCANPEGMTQSNSNYTELSIEEILNEALSCKPMFFSGGGVTFTGGEPTFQFIELTKALKTLKSNGINTAVETNATHKDISSLFPYIDHLIMDYKHYDTKNHKAWTGLGNDTVKKNFELATKLDKHVIVRIPVINGFNNAPDGFVHFFTKYNTDNISFEILPYHEYGKEKWTKPYEVQNGFITDDDLKNFENTFIKNNLKIIHM